MSAVGQACGGAEEIDPTAPCEIVGVVEGSAYADFTGDVLATRYQPFLQTPTGRGQMALHVRIGGAPSAMIPAVRAAVSQVDPTLPLFEVQTLAQEVDAVLVRERLIATLASLFGLVALALAGVGLYGLLAFAMARRTPEFGMRVALGAASRDVLRMVMLDAAALVGVGGVIGMTAGVLAARWAGSRVSGLLYGVEVFDRTTLIVAPLVLVAVALAAAYLPARRASRVDPVMGRCGASEHTAVGHHRS